LGASTSADVILIGEELEDPDEEDETSADIYDESESDEDSYHDNKNNNHNADDTKKKKVVEEEKEVGEKGEKEERGEGEGVLVNRDPLVVLSKTKNDGKWIVESGSQSLGALRPQQELVFERTGYDEFYYIRHFCASDKVAGEENKIVEEEGEGDDVWKTLRKEDFFRQITLIGKLKGRYVLISVKTEGEKESKSQASAQYRALMRTYKQDVRFWLTGSSKQQKFNGKNVRVFLEEIAALYPKIRGLKEVRSTQVLRSLVALECFCSIQAHTVPIILATEKNCEGGILHNTLSHLKEENHDKFHSFLLSLGNRINLENWQGYHGSVDVQPPYRHGQHAIQATLHHRPVLMPVVPWFQRREAAEFVSGCSTVLVYVESGTVRLPLHFHNEGYVHSYIVVRPEGQNRFSVQDVFACSLGRCRPTIPRDYLFEIGDELTEFLLYKMINSDRAASYCREPECLDILRRRNRQELIDAVVEGSSDLLKKGGGKGKQIGGLQGKEGNARFQFNNPP